MGSIDRPSVPRPAAVTSPTRPISTAGKVGLVFGSIVCLISALTGLNMIAFGLGLAFIAAGFVSRQPEPTKVCAACRSKIPAAATLCGHCRTEQPS
mgnify:CR=1 FL=1